MAVSPLDKPPYTPLHPPPTADPSLQQIENWVKQELDTIARGMTAQPGVLFTPNNVAPARPRTGMEAYADGTNWNPGNGKGVYYYDGTKWVYMGYSPAPGQIPGTTTNDNAAAGNVGEYQESVVGTPLALTRFTPTLLTSLLLTAGDWNVWGTATFQGQTNDITVGLIAASISSGSSPPTDLDPTNISELTGNNSLMFQSANIPTCTPPLKRFSFATTTTLYLMVYSGFTASASHPSSQITCFGAIRGRRVR